MLWLYWKQCEYAQRWKVTASLSLEALQTVQVNFQQSQHNKAVFLDSLVNAEGPSAECCHGSLQSLQEPPVETWTRVEWTDGWSYIRKVCTVQSLKDPEEGRQDSWGQGDTDHLHWCQVHGKACCLAVKVWGSDRGICYSSLRWWWCFLYCQRHGPQNTGHYYHDVAVRSLGIPFSANRKP